MIPDRLRERLEKGLAERDEKGLRRRLACWDNGPEWLNLAGNDYLGLARDPAVVEAARAAAARYGCSASASPLITGYGPEQQALEEKLCQWHGFSHGLVWNSGYAANQALLSHLTQAGDLVLADRLIHHSMVSGILRGGARLIRYRHNDLDHLAQLIEEHASGERILFVVTESVFSMDGDYPDLARLAALKKRHRFCLIVDEAHALGWYGPGGAGLAAAHGSVPAVDILVGTLGKTLGSQGAYALFHESVPRDFLINHAGEFIFSTYLSPIAATAASAALDRCRELAPEQSAWHKFAQALRRDLRARGWNVPEGDSPILPILVGSERETLRLAAALREKKIMVGAVRPPTVPAGSSRLRLSLNRQVSKSDGQRLLDALEEARG